MDPKTLSDSQQGRNGRKTSLLTERERLFLKMILPRVALVGNPNSGKTALFNALTGGHAKVGNYPGVTVERKEGRIKSPSGQVASILDLPGTYSLEGCTPDEFITRDVILGREKDEKQPDLLIAVVDSTQLSRGLAFILELRALNLPIVLALNMTDLAAQRGMKIDIPALERNLQIPVIATSATKKEGVMELLYEVLMQLPIPQAAAQAPTQSDLERHLKVKEIFWHKSTHAEIRNRFLEIDRILAEVVQVQPLPTVWTDRIDRVVLHPVLGLMILLLVLGFMFQAIFTWAQVPMDLIKEGVVWIGETVTLFLGKGPLESLIVDGMIAGVGSVLVFIPQIILLFFFILIFEDSGYMARAAFLMDRLMSKVGLNGRAFIPLLSSHACSVPGIMAARTIADRKDRLITILAAPLMTCSARLPVYSLLIAAFIPNILIWYSVRLQGLVMLGLYLFGIFAALGMALLFRKTILKGNKSSLLMELPTYKWPSLSNIFLGLLERSRLFIQKAGTVILTISVLLWFLSSYPKPPAGSTEPPITSSYAGMIGHALEPIVRPLGFNWKIAVALVPGFAAREVMIGALATVYAVESQSEEVAEALSTRLSKEWSLATALSLLVWYVLACQCLSTLAVTRRETGGWRWPLFMLSYMTGLAYVASFMTYRFATFLGWG